MYRSLILRAGMSVILDVEGVDNGLVLENDGLKQVMPGGGGNQQRVMYTSVIFGNGGNGVGGGAKGIRTNVLKEGGSFDGRQQVDDGGGAKIGGPLEQNVVVNVELAVRELDPEWWVMLDWSRLVSFVLLLLCSRDVHVNLKVGLMLPRQRT